MPFAGYEDFEDCVNKNRDKENPEAYCAAIEQRVREGSSLTMSKDSQPKINTKNMVERKNVTLTEVKMDSEAATFSGYASVFGEKDLQNDIIRKGAFRKTIQDNKGVFVLLDQHDVEKEIGLIQAEEDEVGLFIKGSFYIDPKGDPNKEIRLARETYVKMMRRQEAGKPLQFSIGYRAINPRFEKGSRILEEVGLAEVSTVTFPAAPLAITTSVKSEDPQHKLFMERYQMAIGEEYPIMAVDVAVRFMYDCVKNAMMMEDYDEAMEMLSMDLNDFAAAITEAVDMYKTTAAMSEEDMLEEIDFRRQMVDDMMESSTVESEPFEEHSEESAAEDAQKTELLAHLLELKKAAQERQNTKQSGPNLLSEEIRKRAEDFRHRALKEISNV